MDNPIPPQKIVIEQGTVLKTQFVIKKKNYESCESLSVFYTAFPMAGRDRSVTGTQVHAFLYTQFHKAAKEDQVVLIDFEWDFNVEAGFFNNAIPKYAEFWLILGCARRGLFGVSEVAIATSETIRVTQVRNTREWALRKPFKPKLTLSPASAQLRSEDKKCEVDAMSSGSSAEGGIVASKIGLWRETKSGDFELLSLFVFDMDLEGLMKRAATKFKLPWAPMFQCVVWA